MKKIIYLIGLICLIIFITLIIYVTYNKYLDDNYSALATVISIEDGNILYFNIYNSNFLDNGTYCMCLSVLKVVKKSNGESFDRFSLKYGDKIKVTAYPKKLGTSITEDFTIIDGIVKLELLD